MQKIPFISYRMDYAVNGSISKFGSGYLVMLKLHDTASVKQIGSVNSATCATVDEARRWFESVPNHTVGSVFYVADSEKFMRVECCHERRVYEVVETYHSEHFTQDSQRAALERVRRAAERAGRDVGVLQDLEVPRVLSMIEDDLLVQISEVHG